MPVGSEHGLGHTGGLMSKPLIVISAVGLTPRHLGGAMPTLTRLAEQGRWAPLQPALPAVTTTAQTTMLTVQGHGRHGIVGNGWYFRDLGEIWFWRQSEALIQAPLVWQTIRQGGRPLKVLKHFWWYAMNTSADTTVTPRPVYYHDGRKGPDCYAWPPPLKEQLTARHGVFPLFNFWGPTANERSSRWIAESFATAYDFDPPDLALIYLPHLDYDLQRHGPAGAHLERNLRQLDDCVARVADHAAARGARIMIVSEYGLEPVQTAIFINRHLRERGWLQITCNAAGGLLDPGTSRAFAVCDHQLAHIYVRAAGDQEAVWQTLRELPGVGELRAGAERRDWDLDHSRSGEIVALAEPGGWFAYDYWLEQNEQPDFARCIEIHKKPGYDPREVAFDPHGGRWRAARALCRKMLGGRYVLDPVSLDPAVVKGSHGRLPAQPADGPLIIVPRDIALPGAPHQKDVAGLMAQCLAAN